jgi:2-C-methyl-D-erythritol 4-phosphate cytidylyltransferase
MDKYAVIVAGGAGLRMGQPEPKQFLLLKGRPVLFYTIQAFLDAYEDIKIILVLPAAFISRGKDIVLLTSGSHRVQVTAGGETRFHSVKQGLKLVTTQSIVYVHDGVRCLITPLMIQRCYKAAMMYGNAIPAVSPVDSIRLITGSGNEIVDRSKVRIIQTPQTFASEALLNAFRQDYDESFTDEAAVVERTGVRIHLVEGEATNIKITRPVDLLIAEKILEER